jgi:hypothetical protein
MNTCQSSAWATITTSTGLGFDSCLTPRPWPELAALSSTGAISNARREYNVLGRSMWFNAMVWIICKIKKGRTFVRPFYAY